MPFPFQKHNEKASASKGFALALVILGSFVATAKDGQ